MIAENRHCAFGRATSAVFAALVAVATVTPVLASELSYRPVNPNFGGNAFNSTILLETARAQNGFRDNSSAGSTFGQRSALDNFASTLQSRLLSQISGSIVEAIYGENAQDSGNFIVGDTRIDFVAIGDNIQLTISDSVTGETTTITVPRPQL